VASEPAPLIPSAVVGGRECILVVEDNEAVRMITADLLSQLGYDVIEARQPQEALEVLRDPRHIDLMFSDVVMPGGLDGFGLAQEARRLRPGLRLLLTSGFTEFGDKSAMGLGEVRVLGKPFRQSELAHALREVLDAETTA
jgi:CheY-like chemotaxis protein